MLYSTYRPHTFKEVVGQESNTITLKEQSKTKKFDSAYLFAGHRGTGKRLLPASLQEPYATKFPMKMATATNAKTTSQS